MLQVRLQVRQRGPRPFEQKIKRSHISPPWGKGDTSYKRRKSPLEAERRGYHSVADDDKALPYASGLECILEKNCTCVLAGILGQVKHGKANIYLAKSK